MSHARQTVDEIYTLIRQAILAKNILAVSYRGSGREMCPHVLGKTKGSPYALMYQFAGESKGGLKRYGSPRIGAVSVSEELFHVAVRKSNERVHHASTIQPCRNCVDE